MIKTDLIYIGNEPGRKLKALKYIKKNRSFSVKSKIASFMVGGLIAGVILFTHYYVAWGYVPQIGNANKLMETSSLNGKISLKNDFAVSKIEPILREVEMTYYTETSNPCANGKHPRKGICAYRKQDIGKCAIIYTLDHELIGYYEIYDTGYGREESNGKGTIQNGNCVDIFSENDSFGRELIEKYGNKVLIQIIDGKG